MSKQITESINIFLDSGIQKIFVPLRKPEGFILPKETKSFHIPDSLRDALKKIDDFDEAILDDTKVLLDKIFTKKCDWSSPYSYLKIRFGEKTWHFKNGQAAKLNGIWFMIETNTSGQDENKGIPKFDRGYFYQSNCFTNEEKEDFKKKKKEKISLPGGATPLPYIDKTEGAKYPFDITYFNPETGEKETIDFGSLTFQLDIKKPNGAVRDVDVFLDLGNTRSAGLLFEHIDNNTITHDNFKQSFKVLRLKPDPSSGEYDSLSDVEAGIASSWIVLHQLEHQKYLPKDKSKKPELLLTEYNGLDVEEKTTGSFIFKRTEYECKGNVIQRIPQMYTQLSPVLIGDQAERVFNLPYAKSLISRGANLQQSSPKRYYWDDAKQTDWWNMLLNEWDGSYIEAPNDLQPLQGEMLRFIRDDGTPLDLSKDLEPAEAPNPYPEKPAYPNQSTLTWLLLHILERAYSQLNAFQEGQDCIPHRLRKVSITYPSGWTNDEVELYRKRCQEALDIFSQTNVYNGVKSPYRLEMAARDATPDEAVAGQLPFVFSEVIRYPWVTAAKWISLVGKKRSGTDTVRIMNFDIGGGTSDISIVEYKDENNNNLVINQNILSTSLLFKDGQANAGDNLIKKIIEKVILGGLLRTYKSRPDITKNILDKFRKSFDNKKEPVIRRRIIRTCLVPLATLCLARLGEEGTVEFSAQEAGINSNNWDEFLKFIHVPGEAIGIDKACFAFNAKDINDLIEAQFSGLFQNCAMYAAAYDVDLLIFSGKPSELPYIRTMAERYIPIDSGRIIFARGFKAGNWYPFTDSKGFIEDAKTVTVVGSALYYALSKGLIEGWKISSTKNIAERNEWGQLAAMNGPSRAIFLPKGTEEAEITILPNTIIARRQNRCSSPEPVYKFIQKGGNNNPVKVRLKRNKTEDGESLSIESVGDGQGDVSNYELKLWPCETATGFKYWQEEGEFNL